MTIKFQRAIMLTSVVVLALTCLSFITYEFYTFRNTTISHLSVLGEVVAENSTAALAFYDVEDAALVLAALKAEEHIVAARLYDKDGKIFSQYPEASVHDTMPCKQIEWGYRFSGDYIEGYQRVKNGDTYLGALYIQSNLEAMNERFKLYALIVFVTIICALVLTKVLGKVLQKEISQPLFNLSATANAIAKQRDYTVRAERPDDFELGALTDAFNHMLEQIEQRDEALSDFNKKLEVRVFERTHELRKAIEEQQEAERKVKLKNQQLEHALEELQKAEHQLIQLNSELEQRVMLRTNELKISEGQLRLKNTELERTIVDLDNFVYRASHDLKSPISNIEGLTVMFKRQLEGRLNDDEKKMLDMIELSLTKFSATISDLTEISKVQKDQNLPVEVVRFDEVLDGVKEDIWQLVKDSGVEIREDFKVEEITYASPNLRSIIYNLVSNAIKYRSSERPLLIEISTYTENDRVVLKVKDNGLGMDPANLEKIFTMFKRLHAHVDGSGIGLYITKRIIENRGGYIEVSSEVDKGSEFKVVF